MPTCECGAWVSATWARVFGHDGEVASCTECAIVGEHGLGGER